MSKSLYKKHRPKKPEQIVGNTEVVSSIQKAIKANEVPQVILFVGPTGCGKTTLGRILASEVNAKNNITEMDSAQFTGVDTIREIRKKSRFMPIGGGNKVYLMDEVHMLSPAAQEAFLKELEDTPKHVYYFLCTTNPEKLKPTLKGRCIIYEMETLSNDDMTELLKGVVKKEKEELDKKVYRTIVKNSEGHPRNALNILQQVLSVPKKKRLKIAEKVELEKNESIELCRSLIKIEGYGAAQEILKGLKTQDAEGIRRHVLGYCQSVLLGNNHKSHHRAAQIAEEFSEPTYNSGFIQIVTACFACYHSE